MEQQQISPKKQKACRARNRFIEGEDFDEPMSAYLLLKQERKVIVIQGKPEIR